ncbi:hypothetical protein RE428_27040 [Marinobacter nanhaiticus D15-8W]|nr:hypothetical protein RE428_27040 [Marinobacter nanhaiticus D15-8W]
MKRDITVKKTLRNVVNVPNKTHFSFQTQLFNLLSKFGPIRPVANNEVFKATQGIFAYKNVHHFDSEIYTLIVANSPNCHDAD